MPTREGQPCASTRPAHCIDRHPGGYLTAVYWLEKEHGERLRTGELGDHLDVSPASATEMAERLAADGFVDHVKHRGIELTERGATVGQELARRQCIVRTFFVSELDAELASTGDTTSVTCYRRRESNDYGNSSAISGRSVRRRTVGTGACTESA